MGGLVIARLAILIGLFVSSGLLIEILGSGSGTCSLANCDDVLHSAWSRPLGIPLPILGTGLFITLLGLSLCRGIRAAWLFQSLAMLGAMGGVGLIAVQSLVLHRICPYCLIVDCMALLVAIACFFGGPPTGLPRLNQGRLWSWILAGLVAAISGGLFWTLTRSYQPPEELIALTDSQRVTIVEIGNPRCRHCRAMHQVLERMEKNFGDRILRISVLLPTPDYFEQDDSNKKNPDLEGSLPEELDLNTQESNPRSREGQTGLWQNKLKTGPLKIKPDAMPVARTIHCARRQDKDRSLLNSLFFLTNGDLTVAECRTNAVQHRISMVEYDKCLLDPNLDEEINKEFAWLLRATPRGIPAVWIDGELQVGLKGLPLTERAIARALDRRERRQKITP